MPAPKRQHVTPSIHLGEPTVRRVWATVSWANIHEGDTVPDYGTVVKVVREKVPIQKEMIMFVFPERRVSMRSNIALTEAVFAFTDVKS